MNPHQELFAYHAQLALSQTFRLKVASDVILSLKIVKLARVFTFATHANTLTSLEPLKSATSVNLDSITCTIIAQNLSVVKALCQITPNASPALVKRNSFLTRPPMDANVTQVITLKVLLESLSAFLNVEMGF